MTQYIASFLLAHLSLVLIALHLSYSNKWRLFWGCVHQLMQPRVWKSADPNWESEFQGQALGTGAPGTPQFESSEFETRRHSQSHDCMCVHNSGLTE
jgi:hypothetical protein